MSKIILASKSPRRSFLLKEAGFEFEIRTRDTDESYPADLSVDEVAAYIAQKKADAVKDFLVNDEIIITADTIVIMEGKIYEKPKDYEDALRILQEISGKMHRVITGVCILSKDKQQVFSDVTEVFISEMSDKEIRHYLDTCQPFDKAGAYGIQEWLGYVKVGRINGSYANVMGLPVHRVYEVLNERMGKWVNE